MRPYLIISLVIAVLAVIFAIQNAHTAIINIGPWTVEGPLALIIMTAFILGVVVGVLGHYSFRKSKHKKSPSAKAPAADQDEDIDITKPW
jgi:uncharacterized integral membrane protein